MNTYYVDCWCSHNPGKGGWRVLLGKKEIHREDHDEHSNNFYEASAILSACEIALDTLEDSEIYSDSLIAIGWIKRNPSMSVMNRDELMDVLENIRIILNNNKWIKIKFWSTKKLGDIPADFGRKKKWHSRGLYCRVWRH